ncbi:hypothetical protein GMOD_00004623 [Pyrenophora seminiperda CCB06]|uniref:Uncharacterized protein n=1 Tax=Pyrenophora seminiperda CCB06 TaxID=1302712 RepID=A0A3M7MH00_9PLEO|nr:hypothetical protein GMOD_00004623 [Pyrenophora seminiperda CCB06]
MGKGASGRGPGAANEESARTPPRTQSEGHETLCVDTLGHAAEVTGIIVAPMTDIDSMYASQQGDDDDRVTGWPAVTQRERQSTPPFFSLAVCRSNQSRYDATDAHSRISHQPLTAEAPRCVARAAFSKFFGESSDSLAWSYLSAGAAAGLPCLPIRHVNGQLRPFVPETDAFPSPTPVHRSGVDVAVACEHNARPVTDMESQTNELAYKPTANAAAAGRLSTACRLFRRWLQQWHHGSATHFTFAGPSAVPIRPHYVSIPTAITACSPFLPRRHHPCSSQQRPIRFQDATEILLLLIYPVTLASFAKLTLITEPGRY